MVEDGLVLSMVMIMSEQEDFGRLCAMVRKPGGTQLHCLWFGLLSNDPRGMEWRNWRNSTNIYQKYRCTCTLKNEAISNTSHIHCNESFLELNLREISILVVCVFVLRLPPRNEICS